MPHLRASFGHRAATGLFRFQRARIWTQSTVSAKFAPVESGKCTNSPTSPSPLLGDSGLWSQPATGRYCEFSRKRSFREEHVRDSFPDTPWNEPPRKMMHMSSADDEDKRGWSSLLQNNRLSHCEENIWMQPAVSPSLVFKVSVDSVHDFTAHPKYQLSEVCPPISNPFQFQSSHLASAMYTSASMDADGMHARESIVVQPFLPDSPNPLLLIHTDCLPSEQLSVKLVADVSFPTSSWAGFARSPINCSGFEEGISDRAVTSVTGISPTHNSTTCSHRKKWRHEARLRAKAKVVAHGVKLILKDVENNSTPLKREKSEASSRGDTSSLKWHVRLEAIEEGAEATAENEGLRIPRLAMLDKDGRNNAIFDKKNRKGCKGSLLHTAESFLFDKVLTKTDANGLGRIILPKKAAEQYLPHVPCKEGIKMEFEDCNGKVWEGRLRYWVNKSKMYVIQGAGGFLREHGLALGDKILIFSSGSDRKLLFRGERGPFVLQTPSNGTPLSHDTPTLHPSHPIIAVIPTTPIPNPSSVPLLPKTFVSSSTTSFSKFYPTLPRNTSHFSSTLTTRDPSPLSHLPPFTHSPLAPPSSRSLKPKLAFLRPSPLLFVPAHTPNLRPTPFTPQLPDGIPPTIPLSSTKTGYSGRPLDMDPRGKEGILSFHTPHSLFLATTSSKPSDPSTDILSTPNVITTASELDRVPRVRMKSRRLVAPLVVATLLQSPSELHKRCVREMQTLSPARPLIPRNEAAHRVEGWEGLEGGEAVEELVQYVVPLHESNDLDFGTFYTSRSKMEELQKESFVEVEDDKAGVSFEGLLETLTCWDEGSRSAIPNIDLEATTMPQESGGMMEVMTRTVLPNVNMEEVGVCNVTLRAHYQEISDNESEGSKCSTLDSSCSLNLATTESCLRLFGRYRGAEVESNRSKWRMYDTFDFEGV